MPRGKQRHMLDGAVWRKYTHSDEVPPLAIDTVDELEFRLRIKFPEVFEAAREREWVNKLRARGGIF